MTKHFDSPTSSPWYLTQLLQITPSDSVRQTRAAMACNDESAADLTCREAARISEEFRLGGVPIVDDSPDACVSMLRDVLASQLPPHIFPSPEAMVLSGPFGSGKKLLIQRILSLYPDKFCVPHVYTTNTSIIGGNFKWVDSSKLDALEQDGVLAFRDYVDGHSYAVCMIDVFR